MRALRRGEFFPGVTKVVTLAFWHRYFACNSAVTARYIACFWRRLTRHGLGKGGILENLKMEATRLK